MLTVCAAPATAALDIHSAMFAAPDIPFLLTSQQKRRAFLRALRPRLADLLAEHGLTLLAMVPLHPGALFAAKSGVLSADTFAGRPFAASDTASRLVAEFLGAKPLAAGNDDPRDLVENVKAFAALALVATDQDGKVSAGQATTVGAPETEPNTKTGTGPAPHLTW